MSTTHTIQLRFQWAEAADAFSKIIRRDGRFAILPADSPPAGLVVIEGNHSDNLVAMVQELAKNPAVQEIFILAKEKDPDLILSTLRAGATEFLPLPIKGSEFAEALNRFIDRRLYADAQMAANAAPPVQYHRAGANGQMLSMDGQIVTVLGGKFGIGTTTIAVNLAVCYTHLLSAAPKQAQDQTQASTLSSVLVDTRRPQGEIPLFLDLDYLYTWAEATRDAKRLDSAFLQSLLVRHSTGVDILAAPDDEESTGSNPAAAMSSMLEVLKQLYPLTVLDCGPYIDDVSLAALEASDSILMVTELSLPCLGSARRLMDTLENINPSLLDKVRLVVNRYSKDGGISVSEAEDLLGCRVEWRLDDDHTAVISAVNQGLPMLEASPRSSVTKALQQMAESFLAAKKKEKESGSLFQRMFSGLSKSSKSKKQQSGTDQQAGSGQHARGMNDGLRNAEG